MPLGDARAKSPNLFSSAVLHKESNTAMILGGPTAGHLREMLLLLTKCSCIYKTCGKHAQPAGCKQTSIFKTCTASNAQAS